MRFRPLAVSFLTVLTTFALSARVARAQTTMAAPYYATPSWDQKLPCDTQANCPRFIVLSNWTDAAGTFSVADVAVLDRETGLLWERNPSPMPQPLLEALEICSNKTVGNRRGWRLPMSHELSTLVDPTRNNPAIPAGHPFTNMQSSRYWVIPADGTFSGALAVDFSSGELNAFSGTLPHYVWCVRGGLGVNPP